MITPTLKMSVELSKLLKKAEEVWIASALISRYGLDFIQKKISPKVKQKILVGISLPTSPDVLEQIVKFQSVNDNFKAKLYRKKFYHPKLYMVKAEGRYYAIVGSGNCTEGGLEGENLEISLFIEEQAACEKLLAYFHDYFEQGEELSIDFIENYRKIYASRRKRRAEEQKEYNSFLKQIEKESIMSIEDRQEKELDIVIFDNRANRGDEDYIHWINENSDKYVLKTTKSGKKGTIHYSDCAHIAEFGHDDKRVLAGAKPIYVDKRKTKIGAKDYKSLVMYCKKYRGSKDMDIKDCGTCDPCDPY